MLAYIVALMNTIKQNTMPTYLQISSEYTKAVSLPKGEIKIFS